MSLHPRLAALLALCAAPVVAAQDALPELVARTKPAVVTIHVDGDDVRSQGTGFFIAPDRVVTNYHVIEGGRSATLSLWDGTATDVVGLVATDADQDLAILAVRPPASAPAPLTLTDAPPREGERVVVIGSPRGFEQTVSDGIVSAIRGPLVQITAPVSPGSSGGPVVAMDGRVVGVVRMTRQDGQNLNFAVSAAAVRALRHHEVKPLAGNAPPRAAPAVTAAALPGLDREPADPAILDRLSPAQRNWVSERARDFYLVPGGGYLDGYRINRIREILGDGPARRIAGVDSLDHLLTGDVEDRPPLYAVVGGDELLGRGWCIHIAAAPVLDANGRVQRRVQVSSGQIGSFVRLQEVGVAQVLGPDEVLVHFGGTDVYHVRGPFAVGLVDGSELPGDFLLRPIGDYRYTSVASAARTVPSFQFYPMAALRLSPAELARAIERGEVPLTRHRVRVSAGRTVNRSGGNGYGGGNTARKAVGGTARWVVERVPVKFREAAAPVAEPGEPPKDSEGEQAEATPPGEGPRDELRLKDGRVLAGRILEEKGGRIRFLVFSGRARAEIEVSIYEVEEVVRGER